ncbi:MAG: hypothetical protein V4581_11890 [Bacteroidota bacterium]
MKIKSNLIRILAGLSFLIFFCPFLQTCSDASIIKNNHKAETYSEQQEANKAFQDSLKKVNYANDKRLENGNFTQKEEKYLKEKRKEWTFNAYQSSWIMNEDLFSTFSSNNLTKLEFYGSLILPVVILLSLIIFISSLYKKFRLVFKLTLINLILLLLLALLMCIDIGKTEALEMFRYGYYLFIINIIAITVLSYKAKQKQAHAV